MMLSDRVFYPAAAGLAALLVAAALAWPQGYGLSSPWPFGHATATPPWIEAKKHRSETRARQQAPLRSALKPQGGKP
jgi:hypothetical protein